MSDVQPPTSRRAAREAAATSRMSTSPPPAQLEDPAAEPTRGGPTRLQLGIIIGAAALVFILLCTGSVYLGINAGRNAPSQATSGDKAPTRAVPQTQVQPTAIPTCSLDTLASAPALVKLYGSVVNTASGQPVYSKDGTTGVRPAGVMKVLTAAAAISALGPTFQLTTSVDMTPTPGTISLIGQGDATLSRLPSGQSVYPGAPTLATLASKAFAAYNLVPSNAGVPISNIVLDSTYWNPSDNWDGSVSRARQTGGYLSETTALQVDGDRANPRNQVSPRSSDPVAAAGNAFAQALAALPGGPSAGSISFTKAATPSGSSTLASVQSQPVSALVRQMLQGNDDTLAEMLARVISVKESLGGGSASIQQAITTALTKFTADTSGLTIEDGSGESDESQIPPQYMSSFMSLISQKGNGLQYVAAGLPIAAKSGVLAGRFKGSNAVVAGKIAGFSGAISNASTLTGYLTAADGTGESFAFFAEGSGSGAASLALDSLAAAVYTCGKNITNN